jgi:hypothetical protein
VGTGEDMQRKKDERDERGGKDAQTKALLDAGTYKDGHTTS